MSILDEFVSALETQQTLDVDQILAMILAKARRVTAAEAGSIFIARPVDGSDPNILRACSLQNDKIDIETDNFTIPIDMTSIAGYVAKTREILELDDVYEVPSDKPFMFNRSFDDKHGYRSKSMLAFPLKNFNGRVIGVVQLLNHLEGTDDVGNPLYRPFPLHLVDDMKSIMTVLGVMVERVDLLSEISRLRTEVERLRA